MRSATLSSSSFPELSSMSMALSGIIASSAKAFDLPLMNPDKLYSAPFSTFRSVFLVSREFCKVLSHIKLYDESLLQRLKMCRLEIIVHLLDVYEEVHWQPAFYSDNIKICSLEAARAAVGNFWKNFDVFESESDVICCLYTLIPEDKH